MLADARDYFGQTEIDLWIDDRSKNATLGAALVNQRCVRSESTIYLAHVGALPKASVTAADLVIEPVTAVNLKDFVVVKLKGFANSEDEPPPECIEREIAVREKEMRGPGRFFIARTMGEDVAILGYFEGRDRLIFNLATRVPFRMTGIAKVLLDSTLADSRDGGCRSVIINTNPEDTPINWYRRIGFTDEVYWRQTYRY
jgi:ribosomal protein S18 acetylase RimI-like enzyme